MADLYTLDELDQILRAERHDNIGVSAVDGLVAALIAGPATIASNVWLVPVVGEKAVSAPEGTPTRKVVDTLIAHYEQVRTTLEKRPRRYVPQFMRDGDEVVTYAWSVGFMMGIGFDQAAWTQVILSPLRDTMAPILACSEPGQAMLLDYPPAMIQKIQADAHHHIGDAVVALHGTCRRLKQPTGKRKR